MKAVRIAFVRTWTYVTHQRGWLDDPGHWQAKTRELEDRLSDALHEALQRRFVGEARPRGGSVLLESDPEEEGRAAAVVAASDDDLGIAPDGRIWWGDQAIGGLYRGAAVTRPRVLASRKAFPTPARRAAVRAKLEGFVERAIHQWFAPLEARASSPAATEILREVVDGLGSCRRDRVRSALRQLDKRGQSELWQRGVKLGKRYLWAPPLLEPEAVALRSVLWSVSRQQPGRLVPGGAPTSFPRTQEMPEAWLAAIGYAAVSDKAVRVDVADR